MLFTEMMDLLKAYDYLLESEGLLDRLVSKRFKIGASEATDGNKQLGVGATTSKALQ